MRRTIVCSLVWLALAGCQALDEQGGVGGTGQALFAGPYEMQNWTVVVGGAGEASLEPASGPSDWAEFSYSYPFVCGLGAGAQFYTTMATSGEVSFDWTYTFDLGWTDVTAIVAAYSMRDSNTLIDIDCFVNILHQDDVGPSTFTGSASVLVEEGSELWFTAYGNRYPCGSSSGTLRITNFRPPGDEDLDGVPNEVDLCPSTPEGMVVDANGCSIAQLCPCDDEWKNHGRYVSCVAHTAEQFLADELISEEQKDAEVSAAAKTACGK